MAMHAHSALPRAACEEDERIGGVELRFSLAAGALVWLE